MDVTTFPGEHFCFFKSDLVGFCDSGWCDPVFENVVPDFLNHPPVIVAGLLDGVDPTVDLVDGQVPFVPRGHTWEVTERGSQFNGLGKNLIGGHARGGCCGTG